MAKISFRLKIRKLHKKLPIGKKRYAEIVNSVRAVITDVDFFFFHFFSKTAKQNFFQLRFRAPSCSSNPVQCASFIRRYRCDLPTCERNYLAK